MIELLYSSVVASAGREFHLPAGALTMRRLADDGKGDAKAKMSWVDIASAVSNTVTALAAAAVAVTAWRGVTAWRDEAIGGRRIEMAEQALADIYKAREVIIWVRSPVMSSTEGQSRKAEEGEDDKLKRFRDTAFVPLERISSNANFFAEIQSKRYRIMSVFGADAAQPYQTVQRAKNEIWNAANVFGSSGPFNRERDTEFRKTIWGTGDQLERSLDEAVALAEKKFRPFIEERDQRRRWPRWLDRWRSRPPAA